MENFADFSSLMETIAAETLSDFNLKWLKSVCDTYVDHDESMRGLIAMSISMFLNTLKISDTVRLMHVTDPVEIRNPPRQELYDGYYSLSLDNEDSCLTISRRMRWIMRSDSLMTAIWGEVLSRIHSHSNVLKEISAVSKFPERYFPIDPTGIKDNYGLTYEQLYQD